MKNLLLYIRIRKFYKIYGDILGSDFINKLSDMTYDNLYDVLFDLNEILEGYDDHTEHWLYKLYARIERELCKSR